MADSPDLSQHDASLTSEFDDGITGGLGDHPGHLARRLHQMTYVVWSQVVSDKVTPPQFVLLHILASSPLSDQKTLSERSHFDQSTIADVTRRLVSRGYIRRERDLVDRRRNLLTITEEGLEVLAELRLRTMMMNEIVLGALSLSEQKTFLELGQRVIDATERLIPKAPRRGRMQTFSLVTSEVDSPHLT